MEALTFSAMYFKPHLNRASFSRNTKDSVLFDSRQRKNLPGFLTDTGGMFHPHRYACTRNRINVVEAIFQSIPNDRTSRYLISYLFRAVPSVQGARSRSPLPCQVTREESGGTMNGESILLNEQSLERELQTAIEEENYTQAAKIRDSLRLLQEDSKASVLAANARFYNSFRNGDLASMQSLWSNGDHVCVVHPGVSGISGNDLVMGSWEFVWADYEFPLEIEIKDVQVHVRGDVGYVTCIEMVKTNGSSWGRHFASNVFEKIDGQWFMCIHHASYVDL